MKRRFSRRLLSSFIALGLLGCTASAVAATGARVVVLEWSPLAPDQQHERVLFDSPSLVSDSLQNAWAQARPLLCDHLKAAMGKPGAAAGQTLRDIVCKLDPQVVLEVTRSGPNALLAALRVGGYVEATSTTPTALGKYADPRFSLAVTGKLELALQVQQDRARTLHVSRATFKLEGATLDSHNFSGDVLQFVTNDLIPFFGGPNYKRMAEQTIDGVAAQLAGHFNQALQPVNERLAGPSDAIRVGVSAAAGNIRVTFAPREIAPPSNGRISGVVRWDPHTFTPRNGCRSFQIEAEVQTGPRRPDGMAPKRQVGTLSISPAGAASCSFTLNGLAAGWPNALSAEVAGGNARPGSSNADARPYVLAGEGWDATSVVPRPAIDSRNFLVKQLDLRVTTPLQYQRIDRISKIDGLEVNPSEVTRQPGVDIKAAGGPVRNSDVVKLNPQPLPPGPDKGIRQDTKATRLNKPALQRAPARTPAVAKPDKAVDFEQRP